MMPPTLKETMVLPLLRGPHSNQLYLATTALSPASLLFGKGTEKLVWLMRYLNEVKYSFQLEFISGYQTETILITVVANLWLDLEGEGGSPSENYWTSPLS